MESRPLQIKEAQLTYRKAEIERKIKVTHCELRGAQHAVSRVLQTWTRTTQRIQNSSQKPAIDPSKVTPQILAQNLSLFQRLEKNVHNAAARHLTDLQQLKVTNEQAKKVSELLKESKEIKEREVIESDEPLISTILDQRQTLPQLSFIDNEPRFTAGYSYEHNSFNSNAPNVSKLIEESVPMKMSHQVTQNHKGDVQVAVTVPNSLGENVKVSVEQSGGEVLISCVVPEYQERIKLRERLKRSFSKSGTNTQIKVTG